MDLWDKLLVVGLAVTCFWLGRVTAPGGEDDDGPDDGGLTVPLDDVDPVGGARCLLSTGGRSR